MSSKSGSASGGSAAEGTVRVRALFDFDYASAQNDTSAISFKAGDEWYLVAKTSDNWWLVCHQKGSRSFYVPASYVEVVEKVASPVSPSAAPIPKPRKLVQISLEDSVLKELDSILDLEESTSPQSEAVNQHNRSMPVPDYDDNSESEGESCYVNISTVQRTMKGNQSSKRNESDTSDYRTDSHESLDRDSSLVSPGADVKQSSGALSPSSHERKQRQGPVYQNTEIIFKSVRVQSF